MKFLLITINIFFNLILIYTQNFINYDEQHNIDKTIIIELDSLSSNEIFNRSLNWIKRNHKTEKSILNQIENEYIRFQGNMFLMTYQPTKKMNINMRMEYDISLSFKNEKIRIEVNELLEYYENNPMEKSSIMNISAYFDKNNNFINSKLSTMPSNIENNLNNLILNLTQYIKEPNKDDDDW